MQMDSKIVLTDQDGQKEIEVRKPFQSPVLKRMGAIQEVLQASLNLGDDSSHSAAS